MVKNIQFCASQTFITWFNIFLERGEYRFPGRDFLHKIELTLLRNFLNMNICKTRFKYMENYKIAEWKSSLFGISLKKFRELIDQKNFKGSFL